MCSAPGAGLYDSMSVFATQLPHSHAPQQDPQAPSAPDEPYVYTSIRYDPILRARPDNTAVSFNTPCPFYMLEHHWTRLQVANWAQGPRTSQPHGRPADFLRALTFAVRRWLASRPEESPPDGPLRIRLRMYPSGRATTEIRSIPERRPSDLFPKSFEPTKDAEHPEWTVILDHKCTETSEATMFKIWDRSPQSRARADAGIFSLFALREVLLYNKDLEIIDGSNSTPYFRRNGGWVTPISSSGGLQGTTRRWALEQRLCTECAVLTESLRDGEVLWFSNAVNGFFRAVYRVRDQNLRPSSRSQFESVLQQLS